MRILFSILISLAILHASGAIAADLIRVDAASQMTVKADHIVNNDLEKTILAQGEVEVVRDGQRLVADKVLINTETMIADATGNVRFTTATEVLYGTRMLADMNNGIGKIYEARLLSTPTHFYLSGQEIEKVGPDTYRIKDGSFTPCDGEDPVWRFSSQEMNVELEGYGTASNVTFDIQGVPVVWAPWLIFPAKTKRQSGLLLPEVGYSDRDGFTWNQSYFQTLGDSQDLTLTANIMSRRGVDWGLEYRYNLDDLSRGMFMVDLLPDDALSEDLYKDGTNAEDYGSRYWIRAKADHYLSPKTSLRLDLDIASDRDYLQEFNFGETGYDSTKQRFRQWFYRDLDTQNSLTRTNVLNLNHLRETEALNAAIRYNDRLDNVKTTLQQMPYVSWDMTRRTIADSPLYFQMDSSYSYYYREEGSKGHAMYAAPVVSMPLNFQDYLIVEPSMRWRPWIYTMDLAGSEENNYEDNGFANDFNFTLDSSTYLYSVYDLSSEDSELLLKHAVRPRITYTYQSALSGNNLPILVNRNEAKYQRISYGLENSFTLKTFSSQPSTDLDDAMLEDALPEDAMQAALALGGDTQASSNNVTASDTAGNEMSGANDELPAGPPAASYREFMRLNIYHSYYTDPYLENYSNEERDWGNIEARWELTPFSDYRLSLTVDAAYDVYRADFDEIRVLLSSYNERNDYVSVDYVNTAYDILNPDRNRTHQVRFWTHVNIAGGFSLTFNTRYDIERSIRFENTVSLNYRSQCWGISFIFHEDDREQGYYVAFDLAGLGNMLGR